MNEQEFMARISGRLGRKAPPARPQRTGVKPFPAFGITDPEALIERFTTELPKIAGNVYRAASQADVARLAVEILAGAGRKGQVVRWDDPSLEGYGLDEALSAAGYAVVPFAKDRQGRDLVEAAEKSVAGITGVDMAVAESGTLVMSSHRWGGAAAPGRGRVVGLLPPLHIAIVRKEQFVYSSLEVFRKLAASGPLPSQVIFASGPSRTSDIENDLTIGVHGPGQVHVIIV